MELKKKFKIEYLDPNSLIPYLKNAKTHPEEQINKIAGQINEFGFDQPVVINKDKIIIKGHGRTLASIKLGLKQIPVIVQTLDEYQEMAARIADNKVSESPWDNELLKFDLGTLQRNDFNLELTALEPLDVDKLLNPEAEKRQQGEGIQDEKAAHDTTDIRQIILIMTQEEFEPMLYGLMKVQEKESLDNNAEAVRFLLEMYETNNPE